MITQKFKSRTKAILPDEKSCSQFKPPSVLYPVTRCHVSTRTQRVWSHYTDQIRKHHRMQFLQLYVRQAIDH